MTERWDLSRAAKPVDSWWTVAVIDPLALRVLPLLLRSPRITPNAVTGLAFVVGIGAVAGFATGRWVLGALLYEARFFLDCLDGKIARVKRLSSPAGAMFDRLADAFSIPAAYAAIGLALAADGHLPDRLALLVPCAALAVTGVEAVLELVRAKAPPVTAASEPPGASGGITGWARRHRLTLRPWTVEVETLGLFLGPLLLRGDALGALQLGLVGAYAAFVVVDLVLIFRATR